jgi:hypothetical protein
MVLAASSRCFTELPLDRIVQERLPLSARLVKRFRR